MKKYVFIFAILILSVSAILLNSCKKDKVAPMIFLNGPNPMTVILGTTFTDPGATADDNKDGRSITVNIVAVSNVPVDVNHITTLTGKDSVVYSVTDKGGNTSKRTRIVNVVNSMARFCISTTSGNTIDYLVTKIDDNSLDSVSLPNYRNIQDSVLPDTRKNNRIIFTSVCKGITNPANLTSLPGFLRIYGDVIQSTDKKTLLY